ncbi:BglII/BstYI family type II restriction endonuclease [Profundibacter amoris]|uniref:Restriction endonuclease n=1 Tax=Profundibacter amoris TaxID=2171755 RepID=A0A347UG40_9RHOB|nr:BglII/BstYI family type II restriction endonuclease [Profundibacter amoris]AXX97818.1 restriction endonuclease [Profundibacter amoris]
MKLAFTYDAHHEAGIAWENRELKEWVTDVFEAPSIKIGRKCTGLIREHVEQEFLNEGWALNVRLDNESQINVFALKDDLAFQLQTGNASRAPYDLLKLEFLFKSRKIEAAAIALPSKDAAKAIGDNIASAERVIRELKLFDRVITVPILVVAFE